jgi:hypothetical protein
MAQCTFIFLYNLLLISWQQLGMDGYKFISFKHFNKKVYKKTTKQPFLLDVIEMGNPTFHFGYLTGHPMPKDNQ